MGCVFILVYVLVGYLFGMVGDFIDDVLEGYVVVIDNGGWFDVMVWGDILIFIVNKCSFGGMVIDGVCCDMYLVLDLGYLMYSCSYLMCIGKDWV